MKKISVFLILSLICVSTLLSQQDSTGFGVLDYLNSISGKETLAGQHGRDYWVPMLRIAGDYPAVWSEDFLFYAGDNTSSMDSWRTLLVQDAKQHWLQGALVSLMFHACPPTEPEPCDWQDVNNNKGILSKLSDAQWNDLITDGGTLNSNWKARLDVIYPYLKKLNDAGVEVLFRLFHEMNQGAFWWGGRPGANGTRKLYQISHDYLVKTKGLTNLIWVWNVQDLSNDLASVLNNYDPGSDYWDVLALDVYSGNTATQAYTSAKYNAIVNKAAGKPIAIGECQVLPTAAILNSQPLWTYFIGWADLVQTYNSNSTISAIYNAANVLTLSRTGRVSPNIDGDHSKALICNFDDVFPYLSADFGLLLDFADTPGDSPASGKMGALWVPQNNPYDGFLVVYLNKPIDPRNYVGISFLAQTNVSPYFVMKLEQSSDTNNSTQIQDWTTYPQYTGNGEWQEVRIPFNVLLGSTGTDQLGYKLDHNANFPVSNYDRLVIVPAPYQHLSEFTLNIDNIKLHTSWDDETGIPLTSVASLIITAENGMIKATAAAGNSVSLKVYSISGQEIASGMNQVQIVTKGVYIVKATAGDTTGVQKVVVR